MPLGKTHITTISDGNHIQFCRMHTFIISNHQKGTSMSGKRRLEFQFYKRTTTSLPVGSPWFAISFAFEDVSSLFTDIEIQWTYAVARQNKWVCHFPLLLRFVMKDEQYKAFHILRKTTLQFQKGIRMHYSKNDAWCSSIQTFVSAVEEV